MTLRGIAAVTLVASIVLHSIPLYSIASLLIITCILVK